MNKEEILQRTRDEVAKKEYGYRNWTALYKDNIKAKPELIVLAMEITMDRYAIAMCDLQKQECAKNMDEESVWYNILGESANSEIKEPILEAKNIAE